VPVPAETPGRQQPLARDQSRSHCCFKAHTAAAELDELTEQQNLPSVGEADWFQRQIRCPTGLNMLIVELAEDKAHHSLAGMMCSSVLAGGEQTRPCIGFMILVEEIF